MEMSFNDMKNKKITDQIAKHGYALVKEIRTGEFKKIEKPLGYLVSGYSVYDVETNQLI
jgi:hypothetical protein